MGISCHRGWKSLASLYPAVRLVLLSKDIRYAKNALSRFNVTSVARAAIGSVNLLAR